LELRPAVFSDAPAIAPLLAELGYPATADDVLQRLNVLASIDRGVVLVASDDAGIVGTAHANLLPVLHSSDRFAQLVLIVVAERARRRGVGQMLVAACEGWAKAQGCTRMLITSGEERHEAHAFYEAMGYHHYARRFSKRF